MRWPCLFPTSMTEPRWSPSARHITGVFTIDWGPRGLVLGPGSYVTYAKDAQESFEIQWVMYHLFANDMQGHTSARPQNAPLTTSNTQECIATVSSWCTSKRLDYSILANLPAPTLAPLQRILNTPDSSPFGDESRFITVW